MNTAITFPPAAPTLKLVRSAANPPSEKWAATLAEERRRLLEDQEALREREANLRDYEARLRSLQAEIESGRAAPPVVTRSTAAPFVRPSSKAPFADDVALQTAWEKFHRARQLLEAEQSHLRDERTVLHDQKAEVKAREAAVAVREASVAEREQLIAAATSPNRSREPIASERTMSAVTRLTRAPFDMARSVFGGKNKK
jgi:peptidoglycan hydrolase CwlO-like protein